MSGTGGASGTVGEVVAAGGVDYFVTVQGLNGSGTVRLDVKGSGTGITDRAGNALAGGHGSGEVYTVVAATTQPVVGGAVSATGTYGSAFSYAITASRTPLSYTATGLPAGLSLNASSGVISGTPREAGVYVVGLGALNLSGQGLGVVVLRIGKAALKVTAQAASRPYGQANPVFGVTYEGFAAGDTAGVLTRAPEVTTAAGQKSPAGPYALVAGGGVSDRYDFEYVGGTLTVTPVAVGISLGGLTQAYTGQGRSEEHTLNSSHT